MPGLDPSLMSGTAANGSGLSAAPTATATANNANNPYANLDLSSLLGQFNFAPPAAAAPVVPTVSASNGSVNIDQTVR